MKSSLIFYFSALLVFLYGTLPAQTSTPDKINSFESLKQSFLSPSPHFDSAPLWVWNTKVDSLQIAGLLRQFKSNAFGGVFVHPRAGLITPYLSKQWLDLYGYTVQEAKKIGLDVWIYDENSYPSGFAGGRVPAQMPESYKQGEMLEYKKADTLPADAGSYYICLKKTNNGYINITGNTSIGKEKTGGFILFKKTVYYQSPWYGGYSYVDLMARGVTEKFIELTMDPYEKVIGNEFGKTVRGVFSDEPNIEVQYPKSIRWTPDLFKAFKEKWGYALEPNLASLVEETGDWKKIRHNYYQVLLQLFIDRWSKPFSSYAAKKNLEWTGHYWEHEWPSPNHGPDNMAMYAWPQRPGIDMLFNQFDENDVNAQFGNIRSVKELASVANQLNKKRTLSETYGGGGWDLSFNDMKRLGDWEFALGVNTLNQHLSFMSLAGARKYDYPQSFSYQTPWWPYYKNLNQYFARLSLALSAGEQINDILIIEPTTTAWMYFDYDQPDTVFKTMGNQFQQFITTLEHAQVEYDLGSENIIRDHGKSEGKYFVIGARKYKTVVLPPGMENIDMVSFKILEKYAAAGGRIIQYAQLKRIDGSLNPLLQEFYKRKYPGLVIQDSLNDAGIAKYFGNLNLIIRRDEDLLGDLYHYRRKLKDGELLFLANSSLTEYAGGTMKISGEDIKELDLFSGKISSYHQRSHENRSIINFYIPPAGSELYFISAAKPGPVHIPILRAGTRSLLNAGTQVRRVSDNSLTIDFCDLQIGDTLLKDVHVFDAADYTFKHFGFSEGNPWNTSVQYQDNTIKRDTFSTSSRFTATYHFNIIEDIDLSSVKAVVENPRLYKVLLNDHEILPQPGKWWLDRDFAVFEIGKWVRRGKNSLSITASPMSVYAEIEPVYILGDFSLVSADKGWDISKPGVLEIGSWKNLGLPLYGEQISYTKQITISKNTKKQWEVQLGKWKGTVATVLVNKKLAGTIAYAPYTLDITGFIQNGENTVEVNVIGSLKNVLGPFHRKPKPGMVSPWHWRYTPGYPPGRDYDLYDYGLMEDFKISESSSY